MRIFPQAALNDGVRKRELFGWALYDFANSGYTTVVLTAVFNAYFVSVVAGGADWATLAWTCTLAASNLIVMITMPMIGAYGDLHAAKKRLLAFCTAACVLATLALSQARSGDVGLAVIAVIVSNAAYSYGESLIAAFLPELARRDAFGRVSGWGWSFGYVGGMLALGLSLGYVLWAQARGLPATHFVPVTMMITAAVYALASLMTFVWLRERAVPGALRGGPNSRVVEGWRGSLASLRRTWGESGRYLDFRRFLLCTISYQAGISVVIALAAVYAEQALGFGQSDTMALVFLVNIASAVGAFAFGYWEDKVGHQRALSVALIGWIVMTLLAYLATTPMLFWVAAVIAGLCMGSSQSAGRALVGEFAPAARHAEFFGLWTLSTRAAAIVGPVTYGVVTLITDGNHRLAILSTAMFFALGLALLWRVDLGRGVAVARAG